MQKVKITNLTSQVLIMLGKNIGVDDYEYFVKDEVVRETTAYEMETAGLVSIEEIGDFNMDNPDILEEIHESLSISNDENGYVNYIVAYWDPITMLTKRYEMTANNTVNGALLEEREKFYDTNGVLIEDRSYMYQYDANGSLIGRAKLE